MSSSDDIIRGYSPEVMKRLLGYIKPYKISAVFTLIALVLATTAELLMPIVMKRTLDDHLLRRENRLILETVESAASGNGPSGMSRELASELLEKGVRIEDSLFVTPKDLSDLHGDERLEARAAGWLDSNNWYVVSNPDEMAMTVINANTEYFKQDIINEKYAILGSDRDSLTTEERRAIRSEDISGLASRSVQYLILLVIVLVFTFLQVYNASWAGQKIMADIRQGLLGHIMRQSLRYLGQTPVGSLVSRTANDVETINEFFTNVTISFLKDGAIMIGVIAVLFGLDTRLALVALVTLVPTFILIVIFQNRMRESFRRVRARVSSVNAYLSERLGGMATVQLFDAEKRSGEEFEGKGGELLGAELSQMKIMAVFRPLIDLIASVAVALIIWYSTGLHDNGLVTLGVLIAFIELIQKFFQPVKDIAEKFNILQSAMAGGERIFAMMDTVDRIPEGSENEAACDEEPVCGELQFENIHFSYVPGEPVLKGLDFRIEPGQTVAVVGATGAGKTTIANLITRLWDPDSGRILLDGKDVRDRPLPELRRSVQPVQQDVFLFAGTIADNIDLGLGHSREQIVEAAKLSRADEFVRALPNGYDTEITEGASNLSAGQRQLIAFARIIAHDPRVIILDEATANVDTETESLLQEGLEQLLADRTALIIAHRLSTIRRADRIMVLGHGKLIEEGTHTELMIQKGVYHNLYRLQFADGNHDEETPL
jgi:ATP-binding cassette subfamily B multidrug efflux pump